ncbi:hypothetical protein IWQ60_004670 [Tieghemiomyces parasiticus]|uniref:RGS domain-containing protein n=1 Tax=Tieghemiomyces parasiticus TaxID=78921 RepID=A0A9W8ADV6_9FUNG|nr:hypothetical protein IWQ60_004670 [Tieghemiomyces parasiticus]
MGPNLEAFAANPDFDGFGVQRLIDLYEVKAKILIPIIAILTFLYLGSTVLFVLQSRRSRELQRRSVTLTMAGSATGFIVFIIFLLRSIIDLPCTTLMWPTYLGLLPCNLVVLLKAVRLWVMSVSNRAKVIRLQNPEQPETFWERHRNIFKYEKLDQRLLLFVGILNIPMTIFMIVVLARSPVYGIGNHDIFCDISWEIVPITAALALLMFVIFPVTLYKIRNIQDAYLIRHDIIVAMVSNILLISAFYVMEAAVPATIEVYFNSNLFLAMDAIILQVSAVVVPLIQFRRRRNEFEGDTVESNHAGLSAHQTFVHIVEDPEWLKRLCKFCELNFCSELTLFLIEYQKLKQHIWTSESVEFHIKENLLKTSLDFGDHLDPVSTFPPEYTQHAVVISENGATSVAVPWKSQSTKYLTEAKPEEECGNDFDRPVSSTTSGFFSSSPISAESVMVGPPRLMDRLLKKSGWGSARTSADDSLRQTVNAAAAAIAAGSITTPPIFPTTTTASGGDGTIYRTDPSMATPRDFSITNSILTELNQHRDRPVQSTLRHHYYLFYQRFIAFDAMWEVNLSGRTRRAINDLMERNAPTLAMFDTAKDEVCQLIIQDILPKFLTAHFHKVCDFQ